MFARLSIYAADFNVTHVPTTRYSFQINRRDYVVLTQAGQTGKGKINKLALGINVKVFVRVSGRGAD